MGYDIIDRYQCGFSLDKCDAQHLAEAVKEIKKMDVARYQEYCTNAKSAALDFDFNVLTEKLMDVIQSVL